MKAIFLTLFLTLPAWAEESTLNDTQNQKAWLYTPTAVPLEGKTYWLVIGVHGASSNGQGACGIASWAKEDVVVLGPSFIKLREGESYQRAGDAHVTKLKALVKEVGKTWPLHPTVFLHGFSAGAQFVHRFAMKEPSLVAGVSAASAGTWSTRGFGEINPAAKHIPFAISCGERDRDKAGEDAPLNRLDWMQEFSAALKDAGFECESRVIARTGHKQTEETFDFAKKCFDTARSRSSP